IGGEVKRTIEEGIGAARFAHAGEEEMVIIGRDPVGGDDGGNVWILRGVIGRVEEGRWAPAFDSARACEMLEAGGQTTGVCGSGDVGVEGQVIALVVERRGGIPLGQAVEHEGFEDAAGAATVGGSGGGKLGMSGTVV